MLVLTEIDDAWRRTKVVSVKSSRLISYSLRHILPVALDSELLRKVDRNIRRRGGDHPSVPRSARLMSYRINTREAFT